MKVRKEAGILQYGKKDVSRVGITTNGLLLEDKDMITLKEKI